MKQQSVATKQPYEFQFTPVQLLNEEMPMSLLGDELADATLPEGVVLLTTSHMLEQIRCLWKSGRQGAGSVLVTDFTYKINASGWGLGL